MRNSVPRETRARRACFGPAESGFTLVELMIASILLLILGGALATATRVAGAVHNGTQQGLELQQNVRGALGFMARELLNGGSGIPYSSQINGSPPVAVPPGAKAGLLGAPVMGGSVSFVTPGDGAGGLVTKDGEGKALGVPIQTDALTFLGGQGDARFVKQSAPGPTANWGTIVYLEDSSGFKVDHLVLFTNGFQVSLGQVTAVLAGGGLQFTSGLDPLAVNSAGTAQNPSPNFYAAAQFPGGPPPQALPLAVISYFIDAATNPTHPALKRVTNGAGVGTASTVSDDIENLQVQYLVDHDANAATPNISLSAPTAAQLALVRGITLQVTGRSQVQTRDSNQADGHSRLTLSQTVFFRNNVRR